jgi:hypothetical protein
LVWCSVSHYHDSGPLWNAGIFHVSAFFTWKCTDSHKVPVQFM